MASSPWSYFLSCQMSVLNYLYLPRQVHALHALESPGELQTFRSLGPTPSCQPARKLNVSATITNTTDWEAEIITYVLQF